MKAARGKERTLTVILSLVIIVTYLLPVTCKSVFVDPSGSPFVTSKENIIMALTFVAALFFEVEAMKRVIMIGVGHTVSFSVGDYNSRRVRRVHSGTVRIIVIAGAARQYISVHLLLEGSPGDAWSFKEENNRFGMITFIAPHLFIV
jgi:hypothetical protein